VGSTAARTQIATAEYPRIASEIDGLSLLMVVLTGLLGVLAVLCSWREIEKYQGFFHLRGIHGSTNSDCHCGIPADCVRE
jgi:NADH:ubiquinone oxidoreductase subunit 4 (subunit M)